VPHRANPDSKHSRHCHTGRRLLLNSGHLLASDRSWGWDDSSCRPGISSDTCPLPTGKKHAACQNAARICPRPTFATLCC
jgi:hypothetical protein